MAVYTLFRRGVQRSYKTTLCSKATLFVFIVTGTTVIAPLLLAYRGLGFWKKLDYYQEQPEIRFKRKLIVVLESQDGTAFWSTYPLLNSHAAGLRVPRIEDAEDDINLDGKADKLRLSIKMPLERNFHVLLVKVMLLFDCKVQRYARVSYEGLAFVEHASALPGATLSVTGDLRLRQQQPLHYDAHNDGDKRSIIDEGDPRLSSFTLERILEDYSKRNVTTHLSNVLSTWRKTKGASSHFEITLKVRYPMEVVLYRPGLWQVLKQAWTQYLAFLLVFIFLGRCAKDFVLGNQILETYCKCDLTQ